MNDTLLTELLNRPTSERFVWRGRKTLSLPWLLFLVLSAFYYVVLFHTEHYGNNGGLGDDGSFYGSWIQNFNPHLPAMGLHSYSAQRIFPVYFVWAVLRILKLPLDAPHIVHSFMWINFASVLIGYASWNVTARELSLSRAGYLFGTAGVFMSCAVLKWIPFDPVLDDAIAFGFAGVATMAFFRRNYILLAIVTLLGAFTWPSFVAVGCALLFFPRRTDPYEREQGPSERVVGDVISGCIAGWITVAAGHLSSFHPPNSVLPAALGPFRLSCAILGLAVFFGLRSLLRIRQLASEVIQRSGGALFSRALSVAVIVAFVQGVKWISSQSSLVLPQPPHVTYETFTDLTLFLGVQRPGAFIVAHAVFFGPIVLVMILLWSDIADVASRYGMALVGILGLALLMGLNSESRRAVAFAPVLVPLTCVAATRFPWTIRRLGMWLLLSLFCSRVWHTIVQFPRLDGDALVPIMGPWMPNDYMVGQTIVVLLLFAVFIRLSSEPKEELGLSFVA